MRSELIKEVWKPIPNYEGLYEASNFGKAASMRSSILVSVVNASPVSFDRSLIGTPSFCQRT